MSSAAARSDPTEKNSSRRTAYGTTRRRSTNSRWSRAAFWAAPNRPPSGGPKKEPVMKCSRRDLGLLIPSLVALGAATLDAQSTAPAAAADNSVEKLPVMKTQHFKYDQIPVTTNGKNLQRRMFTAKTHTGFKIESHQSDIAPGEVNHPPHQHLREEMMQIGRAHV